VSESERWVLGILIPVFILLWVVGVACWKKGRERV
jgi:hypothetical protein